MKYLVNRETKEHKIYRFPDYVPPLWDLVDADHEGWIKRDGKECPLPDGAKYDAAMKSGKVATNCLAVATQRWDYTVAYRPILNDKQGNDADFDARASELLKRQREQDAEDREKAAQYETHP